MDTSCLKQKVGNKSDHSRHWWFSNKTRFIMLIYLLLCLSSIWCNILSFNIAVLCMHPHRMQNASGALEEVRITTKNETKQVMNRISQFITDTELSNDPAITGVLIKEIIWYIPQAKNILISAVAVGALIAHFPIMWLINRYGIRMVFGLSGILSAFATMLIPLAVRISLYCFITVRALQGIAYAANFSVIGSFLSKWSYVKQNGLFISVLVSFFQLSPAITMPIGGYICDKQEWPYIYYSHGIASFSLFITFIVAYRNSPNKHPFVGDIELKKIATGKEEISKEMLRSVPYLAILSTIAVWAIWICAFANFYYENLVFFFAPTYLHTVLGLEVHDTGLTAAIPPLLHFTIKIACGIASDKLRSINDTTKIKGFNTLAFFGCAACLLMIAYAGNRQKLLCLILLSLSTGFLGFTPGGFYRSVSFVALHYAAFVTGNVSLTMILTMLFVPLAVSTIAPDNTAYQWQILFLSAAALFIVTGTVFLIFGSAHPAIWVQKTQGPTVNKQPHLMPNNIVLKDEASVDHTR